ncbi:hypothetical protein [Antarcticimicrobium luteum]|uniref:Uncharacterized protein n=1 Tax=Antarcticimicrobium luteum TaxID=2547397 RepID=A0A4R5VBP3_9RHOB|nr:hypothetical protein [Antarcticimicrobium luteum]TDK49652.1 hypothetical protein E1832_08640 [Antarcticimicrobium luteum]
MQPHYHVQKFIGDDVLHRIGLYAQTCAHIEHALWLYYFHVDPAHPNDKPKAKKIMDLRLDTGALIKALKKHSKKAHPDDKALLDELILEVEEGLPIRNRLIHGALGFNHETEEYFMFSHWRADRGKAHEYERYDGPLSVSFLDDALSTADNILIRARELHIKAIKRQGMTLRLNE